MNKSINFDLSESICNATGVASIGNIREEVFVCSEEKESNLSLIMLSDLQFKAVKL